MKLHDIYDGAEYNRAGMEDYLSRFVTIDIAHINCNMSCATCMYCINYYDGSLPSICQRTPIKKEVKR